MTGAPAFAVALGLLAWAATAGPAAAVDRSLGADVPKPAAGGLGWSADATVRLAHDLDDLLDRASTLRGAHVGFVALDARSGAVLYARNADDAFAPASTLKLLTGSVALARLGPSYRFRTQALVDAANATLYIRGAGDPFLSATDLDAMAQALGGGIHALPRGVRVDASAFDAVAYPAGWSWDDLAYDYAPVISAATVEENVLHLSVAPGAVAGAPVTVSGAPPPFEHPGSSVGNACPRTAAVVVNVRATTSPRGSPDTVDIARDPGGCIIVTGSLAVGSEADAIDAAVPSPIWYLRALAAHALARAAIDVPSVVGVPTQGGDAFAATSADAAVANGAAGDGAAGNDVSDSVPAGARVVWTHDGEALSDMLADMWWPSDNLAAELLLKAIGAQAHGLPGTTEHGADAERAWLASIGIDPASVTIADGSGLSTYDRVAPRALAAILEADWNGPLRDTVLDDLPIAGVRGTLAHSFSGSLAERRTFAKTGSMNHTRGLAGYLATLHHGAVSFAWLVDDWMGTDADLNVVRANVLSRIVGD